MSLSCTCHDYDGEPGTWAFYPPDDFTTLQTNRRKRCSSCGDLINIGAECLIFPRTRCPNDDIEEKIHGDGAEIPISSLYMCAECGEIYLNLEAAGYCLSPVDDMFDNLCEYWETTGFDPKKYEPEITPAPAPTDPEADKSESDPSPLPDRPSRRTSGEE